MLIKDNLANFLYGFAPTSALLCSGEGDPPGDGGGGNPGAAPVTPPANPGTPSITPEVQALIDQARADERTKTSNSVWKQAREKYEKGNGGQPPPTQQQQPPKTENPSNGPDALTILKLRDDFDDAIGDLSLSGAQKKFLRDMVMEKRPGDVGGFVSSFVEMSGWKAGGSSNPATPAPATPAPKAPQGPPVTGSGAPANPTVTTDDTPLLKMSNEARESLRRRIGDVEYVKRMRTEFRTVRVRG